MTDKQILHDLLQQAGITINGSQPWDIVVHNEAFYDRILTNTELAIGETYVDQWWDCKAPDQFFYKVLHNHLDNQAMRHPLFWKSLLKQWIYETTRRIFNFQTKDKALVVGKKHYDIGNDLYECMLDKHMVYTCAYWHNAKNIDEAQENKLRLVCEKLDLKPGMTVLDVGCGWGSFAKFAAENYGVQVDGVTISREQLALGQARCQNLPVNLMFKDYRDLIKADKKYDRIVSLGMIEHVGYKNYDDYMRTLAHVLKDEGLFLLQTIGSNRTDSFASTWIDTYIFPNGKVPAIPPLAAAFEKYFIMEDWHNFGVDYDKTLMAWYENFNANWDKLKSNYDERFRRMWNYYLLSCAGSFRARRNQLWQVVLSKNGLPGGFQRHNIY